MRLLTALLTAITIVSWSLVWPGMLQPADADELQPQAAPTRSRICIAEWERTHDDSVLLLGEPTTVTLRTTVLCAGVAAPVHFVLVLDGSSQMAGQPLRQMKVDAVDVVEALNLKDSPHIKVGVVAFGEDTRRLAALTNDERRVVAAIGRIDAGGPTVIDEGIAEGLKVLRRGRSTGRLPGLDPEERMVVVSQGYNHTGCKDARAAAQRAKAQGVLVVSACINGDCEFACMRLLANSPRYYMMSNQLRYFFRQIRGGGGVVVPTVEALTISELLPENVEMVAGSSKPGPWVAAGGKFEWRFDHVPKAGLTVTYAVKPLIPGYGPMSLGTTGAFTESFGSSDTFAFKQPYVLALEPMPRATPRIVRGP